jgi:hypothetical protein
LWIGEHRLGGWRGATSVRTFVEMSTRLALAVWGTVIVAGIGWGTASVAGTDQHIRAAPFAGEWRWDLDVRLLPAVVFTSLVVLFGPAVANRLRWRLFLATTAVTTVTWTSLLAARDSWQTPFNRPSDYMRLATTIDSPREFLRTFTDQAPSYPIHVKGHPPGATLFFWALDRAGAGGAGWAGLAVVVAWAAAVVAVVVALAALAGRERARRAAPFVALSPAAVWAGFSADAMFAGVIAVGIALVVVATGQRGRGAVLIAGAGGAVIGLALHLTYGVVPLLAIPSVVIVARRRFDLVAPCAAGAAIVTGLFVVSGFWWLDGLAVTHQQYWDGVAARRPWPYYLLAGNPSAFALATGPAAAASVGLVRPARERGIALLALSALGAVAIANVSGLSKGEVERIWLPFVPWVLTAAALLPVERVRLWLAAQGFAAIALQALLRSTW